MKTLYVLLLLIMSCKTTKASDSGFSLNPKNASDSEEGSSSTEGSVPNTQTPSPLANPVTEFTIEAVPGLDGVVAITPTVSETTIGWQEYKTCPNGGDSTDDTNCTYGVIASIPTYTILPPGETKTSVRDCVPASQAPSGSDTCSDWSSTKTFLAVAIPVAAVALVIGAVIAVNNHIKRQENGVRSDVAALVDAVEKTCSLHNSDRLTEVEKLKVMPGPQLEQTLELMEPVFLAKASQQAQPVPSAKPSAQDIQARQPTVQDLDFGEFLSDGPQRADYLKPVLMADEEYEKIQANFQNFNAKLDFLNAKMKTDLPELMTLQNLKDEAKKLKSLKDEILVTMHQQAAEQGALLRNIMDRPKTYSEKFERLLSDFVAKHSTYATRDEGYNQLRSIIRDRASYEDELNKDQYESLERKILSLDAQLTNIENQTRLKALQEFQKEITVFIKDVSNITIAQIKDLESDSKIKDQYIADIKRNAKKVFNQFSTAWGSPQELQKVLLDFETDLALRAKKAAIDIAAQENLKERLEKFNDEVKARLPLLGLSPDESKKMGDELDNMKALMEREIANASSLTLVNKYFRTYTALVISTFDNIEKTAQDAKIKQEAAAAKLAFQEKMKTVFQNKGKAPTLTTQGPAKPVLKPVEEKPSVDAKVVKGYQSVISALKLNAKVLGLVSDCEDAAYSKFENSLSQRVQTLSQLTDQRDEALASILP